MEHSLFKDIFECSPFPLVLVDSSGTILHANNQAEHLYGYKKDEMRGRSVELIIPPEGRNTHNELRRRFFADPKSGLLDSASELFGLRKDGTKFPIEVNYTPVHSDGDTYIISSIMDITYRIKAEEKFRTAVEAAPNGMVMVDHSGTIVLVNAQVEKMFGYAKAELLGESVGTLVPLSSRERHTNFVGSFMQAPTSRAMGGGRELFGRRKDGSQFPVEVGLRPFHGSEGLYVIGSIVDITERLKDRRKLLSQNEELQQFTYRTSHDLKAPLITIAGLAEYIVDDAKNGDVGEVVTNAEKIVKISGRLRALLEDILALTKAEYSEESFVEISFKEILMTSLLRMEVLAKENNVSISESLSHKKELKSPPTIITHIVDNLLSNAIKYADKKKKSSYVCVRTSNDDENFYIQIEDNGLGIPLEKRGEVFGMFKRFHMENTQGSGLGLYLVKKQVNKLGGNISFESTEQGTTFLISLPLIPKIQAQI